MSVVGTAGKNQPLLIRQGATFTLAFQALDTFGQPIDLTGAVIRSQIRKTVRSAGVAQSFSALVDPDPTTGLFVLRLTAAQTAAIAAGETPTSPESQYVWDLELETPDGDVTPLAFGKVAIHPEVTR